MTIINLSYNFKFMQSNYKVLFIPSGLNKNSG